MSKFLDENGLLYLWSKIKAALSGKVDAEPGMGLSSNDFTDEEKAKLSGLTNYTLPMASKTELGGIKVGSFDDPGEGSGESMAERYSLHRDGFGYAYAKVGFATSQSFGVIRVGDGLAVENGVLSAIGGGEADSVAWDNITGMPDVALKSDITNVYRYKGSVANFAALPTQGNEEGDVWNVEATGMNYAWTGAEWDALGQIFEVESISNAEIDAIIGG